MSFLSFVRSAVTFAAALLFASGALPAAAQTTVEPEAGLDHYYKAQRWMPLRLTLMNQGAPTKVEVRARFSSGSEGAQEYRLPERELQSSANRAHTLYMRAPFHFSTQPITVDFLREGKRINRLQPSLSLIPDGEWLVAGIGPGAASLKQLTTLNLNSNQAAPGMRPMYRGTQNSRINVAVLQPDKVPDRWQGLDAADVVVINGASERDFTPFQLTAIRDYVCGGGRLVVTGGVNWNRLATTYFNELLPVRVTGGKTVSSLPEAASIAKSGPGPSGAIAIAVAQAKPGSKVMMSAGGSPAVVTAPKGMGTVTFVAFDPSLPPLKSWDHIDEFWREIIVQKPPMNALQAIVGTEDQSEMYGGYNPGLQRLADSPFAISQLDIPAFYIVAFFLLSYIIVLVPVNYFVLKAKDKKEYAWLTTPLIVAVFTIGAYMIGYGFKGGRSLVVKVGVVEARAGQDTAPSLTYAGLFSPRKTGYDLRLAPDDPTGQSAATLLSEPFDDRSKDRLLVAQDETQRIEDFSVDMWAMRVIRGDGLVRIGKGFNASLRRDGKQVSGTIRNDTPFTLENCYVVHQNELTKMEDLTPGRVANVNYKAPSGAGSGSILPGTLLTKIEGNGETARVRRALLTPLCGSTGPSQNGWHSPQYPLLVGWIKEPMTPLEVDDRAPREQAANLMIVHLGP